MSDQDKSIEDALERVIEAARTHLAAVRAADGRVDDDDVWQAYVALNNASYEYDELLLDAYGEVTPWDVESIDPDEADHQFGVGLGGLDGNEPAEAYPRVLSVRQRRDYRVPSVAALIRVAEAARRSNADSDTDAEPGVDESAVESVGEAVLELLQAGDGSLGALDVPELEPLDGVVTVTEVTRPLELSELSEDDGVAPFQPADDDRLVGRLDEHPFVDLTGDEATPGPGGDQR